MANRYVYYINNTAFLDHGIQKVLAPVDIKVVEKAINQFNALPIAVRGLNNSKFPISVPKGSTSSNSKNSHIGPNDVWGSYNGDPLVCGSYTGYSVQLNSGWWGVSEWLSHCAAVDLANQFSQYGNSDALLAFLPGGLIWSAVLGGMSFAYGNVVSSLTADDMACGYMGVNLTIYVWSWYSVWKTC